MPHLDFADTRSRLFRDKTIEVISDFCRSGVGNPADWACRRPAVRFATRYQCEEPVADP
jgi:hypothetical protein